MKQTMKTSMIGLTVLIISLATFYSCRHEAIPEPIIPGGGGGGSSTNGKVCFESAILPIFTSSCVASGCHNAASREEGYVLDSYANIIKKGLVPGKATSSELYKVLFKRGDDRMPRAPYPELTDQQKNLIGTWINEGAENSINCSGCDTTLFTFKANVDPILQNNCVSCHNATLASGGVNLNGHSNVLIYAKNGSLYGSVARLSGYIAMPQNSGKLSDCNIRVIEKWIKAGALPN